MHAVKRGILSLFRLLMFMSPYVYALFFRKEEQQHYMFGDNEGVKNGNGYTCAWRALKLVV